jgi:hypothetical protein
MRVVQETLNVWRIRGVHATRLQTAVIEPDREDDLPLLVVELASE